MAQKTDSKLAKARKERLRAKRESANNDLRGFETDELDKYDTFWADCEEF